MPRKPIGNLFLERYSLPSMGGGGGELFTSGKICSLDETKLETQEPQPYYQHPHGALYVGDSLHWLASLETASVDLVFADPPYNLGKAEWDEFKSQDEYIDWSLEWIKEAARVLKDQGTLYICGFSEILADIRRPAARLFASCRWLVWHYKNKANLRNDWGRSHESILCFRKSKDFIFNVDDVRIPYGNHTLKYPVHPQAESSQYGNGKKECQPWEPHPLGAKPRDVFEIPVTSNGMGEKTPHPTQKPEELLRRILLASSNPGGLVIDPFAGSGTTLVCAEQLQRRWAGCDINPEYCSWAVARLEKVPARSIVEWINLDRATMFRRYSIR